MSHAMHVDEQDIQPKDVGRKLNVGPVDKQEHPTIRCRGGQENKISNQPKKNVVCDFCGRYGHEEEDCFTKSSIERNKKGNTNETNSCGLAFHCNCSREVMRRSDQRENETIWIADTGSSIHIKKDQVGMYNVRKLENEEYVATGEGEETMIKEIGDYKGIIIGKDNEIHDITIKDVCIIPSFKVNVLSVTKAISEGYALSNEKKDLKLQKGKK